MRLQIRDAGEAVATADAQEPLVPRVDGLVREQRLPVAKLPRTFVAFVRLLARVHSRVHLQLQHRAELLLAELALEGPRLVVAGHVYP